LSSGLVNHDTLDRTWEEVQQLQPEAVDAVASPTKDMLAVLTPDTIEIYPSAAEEIKPAQPLLRFGKANGETLVMAQWATAKYAEKWISAGQKELAPYPAP
jgi:hypothetical protein